MVRIVSTSEFTQDDLCAGCVGEWPLGNDESNRTVPEAEVEEQQVEKRKQARASLQQQRKENGVKIVRGKKLL